MLKFIKNYWAYIAAIVLGVVFTAAKFYNNEPIDGVFAISYSIVCGVLLFTRIAYDDLREDHTDLVISYIKELNTSLNFAKKSKETLADIFETLEVKEITNPFEGELDTVLVDVKKKPVAKKKKPAAKKTKKA